MTLGWTPAALSAATGEPVDHLAAFADAGLLARQPNGGYDGDAVNRVRLIRFARDRGLSPPAWNASRFSNWSGSTPIC